MKTENAERRLLRTKAAANYLDVSPWTIRRLTQSGELPYVVAVDGGPWKFDIRDLDKFVETHKQTY
jgi:excisionase family DNA binding protein